MSQGSWLNSKYLPYIILALTSLTYSKIFYFLIDDPEGPNLVIVMALAAGLFLLGLLASRFLPFSNSSQLMKVVVVQGLATIGLWFILR